MVMKLPLASHKLRPFPNGLEFTKDYGFGRRYLMSAFLASQVAAQPDVKFISVDEVPADLKEKAAHQGQSKLALSKMQRAQSC